MSYTPRHLRRKGNASRNGTVGPEKKKGMRKAALLSKKFINQPASQLEKPGALHNEYMRYRAKATGVGAIT